MVKNEMMCNQKENMSLYVKNLKIKRRIEREMFIQSIWNDKLHKALQKDFERQAQINCKEPDLLVMLDTWERVMGVKITLENGSYSVKDKDWSYTSTKGIS